MKKIPSEYYGPLVLIVIVFFIVGLRVGGLLDFISIDRWRGIIAGFGPYTPAVYVALFVLLSFLLVPNTPLIVFASLLFPPLLSIGLALTSSLLVAVAGYYLGQKGMTGLLDKIASKNVFVERVKNQSANQSVIATLILRFIPVPYAAQSILCGSVKVRFRSYFLVSLAEALPWITGLSLFGEGFLEGKQHYLIGGGIVIVILAIVIQILRKQILLQDH